ncbi:MFS general substrate transporter [Polyplosphaeria fusca]|uniref:MFS general substrate transporter n=1 Tax=Polyplosphaeria fusca TaxID=682080 RepID=A0A9P4R6A7_9PLEO|nr:MFS general substrate transporter [Polyplosphaeria fusca]
MRIVSGRVQSGRVQSGRVASRLEVREISPEPRLSQVAVVESVDEKRGWWNTVEVAEEEYEEKNEGADGARQDKIYHVFSHRRRKFIVVLVSVVGIFPALSPNIYLPALDKVAQGLGVTSEMVSLSITSYLVMQGIASLVWAPLSDAYGRRPIYIYSLVIFMTANIVLCFSPNFWLLLVFRGIQAAGVASTVSMGAAVIQDLFPASERNNCYGMYQSIRNLTVVAAPIIGGTFSQFLDFRSIFVFLLGLSIAVLILVVLFFPETRRSIAGNGNVGVSGIHRPLLFAHNTFKGPQCPEQECGLEPGAEFTARTLIEPLSYLREKEVIFGLIFGSTLFAVWSMVTVSTVVMFKSAFKLNEFLLGFAFIPSGVGAIAGSTVIGNLLNRDYLAAASRYKASHALPPSATLSRNSLPSDFPLEHTRLARLPLVTTLLVIALCLYGFTCDIPSLYRMTGWITVPLLLQFTIAATANAAFAIHQTLIADLFPHNGTQTAAVCQLVRCLVSALGVGIIQMMISDVDMGPTFVALGLIVMVLVPLPVVQWFWGSKWRAQRLGPDRERDIHWNEYIDTRTA